MAITATTLSGAVAASDTIVNVASAAGINAPILTTGAGFTYLKIDQELLFVTAVAGTVISVVRGVLGTPAQAHVVNSQVQIGQPADFPSPVYLGTTGSVGAATLLGLSLPAVFLAGTTDAIPANVPGYYVVKTASVDAMTLAAPTAAQEGNVISVYSDTLFAHTITATALFANGTALKTTATFPALRGAGVILRATNLVWHVLSQTNITFT